MLALSGGLSWPWVESRYSKHPTGPSSGHSLHRAQGRGERKEQKAGGEQGEPRHGTSCPLELLRPGCLFHHRCQSDRGARFLPATPPAQQGAVDAGFPRSVHTRGGSRCPMGALSSHVRRGGGEAPGSGLCEHGVSGLDPPSPIYVRDSLCLHGFLGCWGVLLPTRCSTRRV